ncbi:MAG TPA: acetyl-CoA carboxylase biotin carboxyl carrier protein [Pyrinomonadaceae bacterium]|jgi:acetyl-CoA carboxylase biotin carboxyl carrier protein
MSDNTGSAKVADKKDKFTNEPSFDMNELQALAALVNEHGFTDFEFENENIRVRLSKQAGVPMTASPPQQAVAAPAVQAQASSVTTTEPITDPDAGLHKIVSPIVGTFYRSSGPDKETYVKEGSNVSPETTVCIVEAMKLMNEIQAEVSGEIVKIYVENGQPVEYGQPLFGVKK